MLDAQMIAAGASSRAAWEKIAPHFTSKDLSPQAAFWFDLLKEWYKRDPLARGVDLTVLAQQGESRITNPKHHDTLMGWLLELPTAPSPDNVAQVALELKRHTVGMELATAIAAGDAKKTPALYAEYGDLMQATALRADVAKSEWQAAVPIENLFDKVGHEHRIPLSPTVLNERTDGGVLPGHHILIYGRPDAGKSTLALSMSGGLALRKQNIFYAGNEDQIDILKARMVSRITGMTWQEIEGNKPKAIDLYRKRGGEEYIRMEQLKHGTVDAIRRRLDELKTVQVLVVDQIRNLEGEGDGMTKQMEQNAIRVRSLLLDYGLIGISVTQANDRTERHGQEPPIWLGMGDVDSSRTGLPAQVDLMIGVGGNSELDGRGQRALSFPKNKLSSKPNAHEGIIVNIDKARVRFT
jgi:KaiC/GvpD/RAD55 family RecA-like ATPase